MVRVPARRKETHTIMSDANAAVENGSDGQVMSRAAERLQATPKACSSNNARRRKAAPKPKPSLAAPAGENPLTARPSRASQARRPGSNLNRPGSKTAAVLELIGRPEGATLQQLRQATGSTILVVGLVPFAILHFLGVRQVYLHHIFQYIKHGLPIPS